MTLIRVNLFSGSGFLVGIFIHVYLGVKPSKYLEGYFYSVSLGLTKISPVP